MRIHKLEFQAVGPYLGQYTIDFDALEGAALFLIDGPTGAGKSTIIDCIVFALYGDMSGEGSDGARIRSKFAGPGDETYVELTFSNSNGIYRVRRNPGYDKKKLRGEGTTPQVPRAVLQQLDDSFEYSATLADKVKAVSERLSDDIVGLTKQQFVQTVVLPQGEFATFLRAETKDRGPLLQKVFGTEIYEKLIGLFQEKTKVANKAREEITAKASSALSQWVAFAGLEDEEQTARVHKLLEIGDDLSLKELLDSRQAVLKSEVKGIEGAFQKAQSELQTADELLNQRRTEQTTLQSVEEAQARVELTAAAVKFAEQVTLTHQAILSAHSIQSTNLNSTESTSAAVAVLDQQIGRLREQAEVENRVAAWPAREGVLLDKQTKAESDLNSLALRKSQLPTALAEAKAAADLQITASEELNRAQSDLKSWKEQAQIALEVEQEQAIGTQLEIAQATAVADAKTAEDKRHQLSQQRLAGMAGELAASLADGQQCPVCGSIDHPQPASSKLQVTQADEDAAEQEFAKLRALAEKAQLLVVEHGVKLASLKAKLSGDSKSIQDSMSKLTETLPTLQAALTTAQEAAAKREQLIEEERELASKITAAESAKSEAAANLESARAQSAKDQEALTAARGDFSSIADRLASTEAARRDLAQLQSAFTAKEQAETSLQTASEALAKLPRDSGFAQFEQAEASQIMVKEIFLSAKSGFEAAAKALTQATDKHDEVLWAIEERATKSKESEDLEVLARTFAKNERGQSLSTFVLEELFEDVLIAANRRFESLLEGRYRLVSCDDDGRANAQRGLGLNVLDVTLNEERSAKTLSGGESFCASLALALGLADIVQANAGGISIETLFIDEGFGSLDGNRLDDVMKMLDSLRKDGRTVGVISHVEEMKSQILDRIVVHAGGKGEPATLEVLWEQ